MEEKKYVVEMPVEKAEINFPGGYKKSFAARWEEETSNIKKNMHKRYRVSLPNNSDYGAVKTASGVVRFSNAKEVKYV